MHIQLIFEQCRGWGTTPQITENPCATLLLALSMVGIHPSMDSPYLVKKKINPCISGLMQFKPMLRVNSLTK